MIVGGKQYEGKVFNDHIHGHVEVSPLAVKIIDTPHFQRLRDISQLGGVNYVFAGATNKRFDHSIGVSHLAREFVTLLRNKQPELNITAQDVLCVEIAGLIHDLGHGPFSHMYEILFLSKFPATKGFVHEHASIGVFDLLIEENDLMPSFRACGLGDEDVHFIKELVLGSAAEAPPGFAWVGRGVKTFLYDIVANKRNGIDVDKFDYFARDAHLLNIKNTLDTDRMMMFSRVCDVPRSSRQHGVSLKECMDSAIVEASQTSSEASEEHLTSSLEICFHSKEVWNVNALFHLRYDLHKRAYQHKTVGAVELMLADALYLADPHLPIIGKNGVKLRMSECISDMHGYWKLQEYLLRQIEFSWSEELAASREIISRLRKRQFYPFVGERLLSPEVSRKSQVPEILAEIVSILRESVGEDIVPDDHVMIRLVKIGYGGNQGVNPVEECTGFYVPIKDHLDGFTVTTGYTLGNVPSVSVSRLIPTEFEEKYIRVYCRHKNEKAMVDRAFSKWCEQKGQVDNVPLTPHKSASKKRKIDGDELM